MQFFFYIYKNIINYYNRWSLIINSLSNVGTNKIPHDGYFSFHNFSYNFIDLNIN